MTHGINGSGTVSVYENENIENALNKKIFDMKEAERNREEKKNKKLGYYEGFSYIRLPRDKDNDITLTNKTEIDLTHDSSGTGLGKTVSHINGLFDDINISNKNKEKNNKRWSLTNISSAYLTHTIKQIMDTVKEKPILKKMIEVYNETKVPVPIIHIPADDTSVLSHVSTASIINLKQIDKDYNSFPLDRLDIVKSLSGIKSFVEAINNFKEFRKESQKNRPSSKTIKDEDYSIYELCKILKDLSILNNNYHEDGNDEKENDDYESFNIESDKIESYKNKAREIINNIVSACSSNFGIFKDEEDVISFTDAMISKEFNKNKEKFLELKEKLFIASKNVFYKNFSSVFSNESIFEIDEETHKVKSKFFSPDKTCNINEKEAALIFIACFKPSIIIQHIDSVFVLTHNKALMDSCFKFINMLNTLNGVVVSCNLHEFLGGFDITKDKKIMEFLSKANVDKKPEDTVNGIYNIVKKIIRKNDDSKEDKNGELNIKKAFFPDIGDEENNLTQKHRLLIDEFPCFVDCFYKKLSVKLIKNNENISDIGRSFHDMIILDRAVKKTDYKFELLKNDPIRLINEKINHDSFKRIEENLLSFIKNHIEVNVGDGALENNIELDKCYNILQEFMLSYDLGGPISVATYGHGEERNIFNNNILSLDISSSETVGNFEKRHAGVLNVLRKIHKAPVIPYTITPESDNKIYFIMSVSKILGVLPRSAIIKSELGEMLVNEDSKYRLNRNQPFKGIIRYKKNISDENVIEKEIMAIPYSYFIASLDMLSMYPANIANYKGDGITNDEWGQIMPQSNKNKSLFRDNNVRDYTHSALDTVFSQAKRYNSDGTCKYIYDSAHTFFQNLLNQDSLRKIDLGQAHMAPMIMNDLRINLDSKKYKKSKVKIFNLMLESDLKILSPSFYFWILTKFPLGQITIMSATIGFNGIYLNEILSDYRKFQNIIGDKKSLYTMSSKEFSLIKSDFDKQKMRNAETDEPCPVSINSIILRGDKTWNSKGNKSEEDLYNLRTCLQKRITIKELPPYKDGVPDFFNEDYLNDPEKIDGFHVKRADQEFSDINAGLLFRKNEEYPRDGRPYSLNEVTNRVIPMNNIFSINVLNDSEKKEHHWNDFKKELFNIKENGFKNFPYEEFLAQCAALANSVREGKYQYIASRSDKSSKIIMKFLYALFKSIDKSYGGQKGIFVLRELLKKCENTQGIRDLETLIEFYDMNSSWFHTNNNNDVKNLSIVVPPRMIYNIDDKELKKFNEEYPDGILIVNFIASKCKDIDTQIELFRINEKKHFLINTMSCLNNAQGFNLQVRVYNKDSDSYIDEDYGILSFVSDQHFSSVGNFLSEHSRLFSVGRDMSQENKKESVNDVIKISDIMMRAAYENNLKWSAIQGGEGKEVLERKLYREHITDKQKKIMQTYGRVERSERTKPLDINFYSCDSKISKNLYKENKISFMFLINDEIGFKNEDRYLNSDIVPFCSTLTTAIIAGTVFDNKEQIRKHRIGENDFKIPYNNYEIASDRLFGKVNPTNEYDDKNIFTDLMQKGRSLKNEEGKLLLIVAYHMREIVVNFTINEKKSNFSSYLVLKTLFDNVIKKIRALADEYDEVRRIESSKRIIDNFKLIIKSSEKLNITDNEIYDNMDDNGKRFVYAVPSGKDVVILNNNLANEILEMKENICPRSKSSDSSLTASLRVILEKTYNSLLHMSDYHMSTAVKNYIKGNLGEEIFITALKEANLSGKGWYKIAKIMRNLNGEKVWTGDYQLVDISTEYLPFIKSNGNRFIIRGENVTDAYERADFLFYSPEKNKILAFDVKNFTSYWAKLLPSDERIKEKKERIQESFENDLTVFRKEFFEKYKNEKVMGDDEMKTDLKIVNINPRKENRDSTQSRLISMWSSDVYEASKDNKNNRGDENLKERISINNEIILSFI